MSDILMPPCPPGRTVAVMQPYFYPYAGYFSLFAAADIFVLLDDVQFPRRGRVHRCEVPGPSGKVEWLTLPLAPAPQATMIGDLAFSRSARAELDERLRRHAWLGRGAGPLAAQARAHLDGPLSSPLAFLEQGLAWVADALCLPARTVRSSSLAVDHGLKGKDYIIALAKAAGADCYVNASGGRALYQPDDFAAAGMSLRFLRPYAGRYVHLLPALMTQDPALLREDIMAATILEY